jgi:hypothetical protein
MTWATIRAFGKVKYFSVSYVVLLAVPIAAEFYRWYNNVGSRPLDFPDGLRTVYAASICYALAIALYGYFCPSPIKHYENEEDYVQALLPMYLVSFPDLKYQIVLANLDDTQAETRQEIMNLHRKLNDDDAAARFANRRTLSEKIDIVYPGCVQRFLLSRYRAGLDKTKIMIWLAALLYFLGTCLMLKVLIHKATIVFTQ